MDSAVGYQLIEFDKVILERYFDDMKGFKTGVLTCAWVVLGCLVLSNTILLTLSGSNYPKSPGKPTGMEPTSYPTRDGKEGTLSVEKSSAQTFVTKARKQSANALILAVFGSFFASTACFWPTFYIPLFGESHGISSAGTAYAVSALNIASIVGRTVPCWIADRTGVFWVIVPSVVLAGMSEGASDLRVLTPPASYARCF